jgi:glycosyltransferase involved in cell wall biosynthesis
MKFGLVPVTTGASGGVYQYSLSLFHALPAARPADRLVVLVPTRSAPDFEKFRHRDWEVESLYPPTRRSRVRKSVSTTLGEGAGEWLTRASAAVRHLGQGRRIPDPDVVVDRPGIRRWLAGLEVDVLVFAAPDPLGFEVGLPFVMAIHDLQHRLHPEFPEVSSDGEYERREHLFRNAARRAEMILVDSDVGREDVLNLYGGLIDEDRIAVVPFVPPPYLQPPSQLEVDRARAKYRLPQRYLYFPAQFWPHKNHIRVVEALGTLRRGGIDVAVVMTGSGDNQIRREVVRAVRHVAREIGVEDLIYNLGYVPNEDMPAMYGASHGVVLPTFFGPTNIPILEAWKLNVPVLTSNIRGVREQARDAAILVDPSDVESIAVGIGRLWGDESERSRIISAGRRRIADYGPDDFAARLRVALARIGSGAPGRSTLDRRK